MKLSSRKKLIIIVLAGIVVLTLVGIVGGLSGWFGKGTSGFSSTLLPEWKYRRPITLSGQTSNLTDYQVKIELTASITSSLVTDGKLQSVASNFADIRFTDGNDNQLLNFWIETASTTATSTIWVKVPGLSASKSSGIYMYYGNSSATSASSGANTFEFFDDFSDGDYTNNPVWAPVQGTWEVLNNEIHTITSDVPDRIKSPVNISNFALIVKFRGSTGASIIEMVVNDRTTSYGDYIAWGSTDFDLVENAGAITLIDNTWGRGTATHTAELRRDQNSLLSYYLDGVLMGSITDTTTASFNNVMIETHASDTNYFDDIRVRKYASQEPTATVGTEQTQMTPLAHWRFDEGTGAIAYNATKKVAETNKWTKRRALSISNSTSTAQTNYQTKVELTTSNFDYSQVKTDGSDIRFVDSDGTELNYWLETWTTSATSTFWVKVPSLPGNTTSTIYMYYGNPSAAAASNGANTFEFFDDFSGDLSKWTNNYPASIYIESGTLRLNAASTGGQLNDIYTTNTFNPLLYKLAYKVKMQDGASALNGPYHLGWRVDGTNNNRILISDTARLGFVGDVYVSSGGVHYSFTTQNEAVDTWYNVELWIEGTTGKIYVGNNLYSGTDSKFDDHTSANIGFSRWEDNGRAFYDNLRVRKYASPEPSVTTVGSQESGLETKLSNPPAAAWISGATWTTGKFNTGLKFDGIDDYVNLGDPNF